VQISPPQGIRYICTGTTLINFVFFTVIFLREKLITLAFDLVAVQRYNPIICREACNNNSIETKSGQKDASKQCSFTSQNRSSSPEIFLPKEWTY